MPTKNKRINLTVPEPLYEKIMAFKDENGIASDAGACLQLISAQLRGLEGMKAMREAMQGFTLNQVLQLSKEGLEDLQEQNLISFKE